VPEPVGVHFFFPIPSENIQGVDCDKEKSVSDRAAPISCSRPPLDFVSGEKIMGGTGKRAHNSFEPRT
jgi:hypothetical protein